MVYPALGMPFCLFLSLMTAVQIVMDRITHLSGELKNRHDNLIL